MKLDAATFLVQWATGGLLFGWVTTRRREVSLWIVGSQAIGGVAGLGTATEEAVAEVAVFSLKEGELLFELVFALSSALMLGLVVGGLPQGVAKLLAGRGAATGLVLGKGSGQRGAGGV